MSSNPGAPDGLQAGQAYIVRCYLTNKTSTTNLSPTTPAKVGGAEASRGHAEGPRGQDTASVCCCLSCFTGDKCPHQMAQTSSRFSPRGGFETPSVLLHQPLNGLECSTLIIKGTDQRESDISTIVLIAIVHGAIIPK